MMMNPFACIRERGGRDVALVSLEHEGEVTLSYSQLWDQATRCAAAIAELLPTASSRRVALMVSESCYWPVLVLALLLARAPFVPLDRSDPRLHLIIEDAEPCLVIARDDADVACFHAAVKRVGSPVKNQLEHTISTTLRQILTRMADPSLKVHPDDFLDDRQPDDISTIFFTSGSTGRPKGCVSTISALASYCSAINQTLARDAKSVVFVASSATFDPSLGDFVSTFMAGGTVVIAPREKTWGNLAHCLARCRATHVLTTPALLATITDPDSLPDLRVVALGGEAMGADIVMKWASKVKLFNVYGVTECAVYQSAALVTSSNRCDRKNIGSAIGENIIELMNSATGNPEDVCSTDPLAMKPVDENDFTTFGEIWIGGPQVGPGYLSRVDLTARRFLASHPTIKVPSYPWFRTGDLATRRPDGGLIYLGRYDTQIKVRGQRVEVEEIEAVFMSLLSPTILSSFVVTLNVESKLLVAHCVLSATDLEDLSNTKIAMVVHDLFRYIGKSNLPSFMVPSRFLFVTELPQTATGKIARSTLSKQELPVDCNSDSDDDADGRDPTSDCGGWLIAVANVWKDVLGISIRLKGSITWDQVGGDSIRAVKVSQKIAQLLKDRLDKENVENESSDFGENLGTLAPAELLRRPILRDYAEYLYSHYGDFTTGQHRSDAHEVSRGDTCDADIAVSILLRASALGLTSIVRHLLQTTSSLGPDGLRIPASHSMRLTTPLHLACLNGRLSTAEYLISCGASLSVKDASGSTPLHLACHSGPLALVLHIIKSRPIKRLHPLALTDDDECTALHRASRSGAPNNLIEKLIELYPEAVKKRDRWGRTSLHWATVNGHRGAVSVLIASGLSDLTAVDNDGETALVIAERRARCGAAERGAGVGSSLFGDIASLLGGDGSTSNVKKYSR